MKTRGGSTGTKSTAMLNGIVMLWVLVGAFDSLAQDRSRDIEQTIERFLVPFGNRDIAAFSAFLAEDSTMFFPAAAGQPAKRVEGRDAIGRQFEQLYERVGPPRGTTTIRPQDLKIQQFDGFAVVTFHLGTDAARGRRTFVLRREGSAWKIVHIHASQANAAG